MRGGVGGQFRLVRWPAGRERAHAAQAVDLRGTRVMTTILAVSLLALR